MEELREEGKTLQEIRGRLALRCLSMKDLLLADIEPEKVTRLLSKIEKNDDRFIQNHDNLSAEDEELVDENHAKRLEEHNMLVKAMRLQLKHLSNRAHASELLNQLDIRLKDLEEDLSEDG